LIVFVPPLAAPRDGWRSGLESEALEKAEPKIEECFRSRILQDFPNLADRESYPSLLNSRYVEKELQNLGKSIDITQAISAIKTGIRSEWQFSDPEKIDAITDAYRWCVFDVLGNTDEFRDEVIKHVLLEEAKRIQEIHKSVKQIEAQVYFLVKQHYELPPAYRRGLERFEKLYLGDEKNKVPFGGRTKEILALDHWLLNEDQPPYAIIAAPAGRGKSALMVVWANLVIKRNLAKVIFIPINNNLETNLKGTILRTLAVRLSNITDSLPPLMDTSAEDLQALCEEQLRSIEIKEGQLLIILDGLDESAQWENLKGFFPNPAAPGVRILVTARYWGIGDQTWRRELGWENESLTKSIPLPELTREGVSEVLESMGNPLAELAPQKDVVSALFNVTEGDPLLIRLFVDLFQDRLKQGAQITIQKIQEMTPGYETYFAEWWKDQRKLWGRQELNPNFEEERALDLLYALAYALGPLRWVDLGMILPSVSHLKDSFKRKSILESLKRFVQGDGGEEYPFTFLHPKLRDYFLGKLIDSSGLPDWEERFLSYCRKELQRLNEHPKKKLDVSPYPIRYYGVHLDTAKRPIRDEEYYELVSEGWMRAWYALEGTYSGFLNDVDRAWKYADQRRDLAMQIKCALCQASVSSLSENVKSTLMMQAIEHNLLSQRQALVMAKQKPSDEEKSEILGDLFPLLDPNLQIEALVAARAIQNEYSRSRALSSLATHLPADLQTQVLQEALDAAQAIQDEDSRSEALSSLAPHLLQELTYGQYSRPGSAAWLPTCPLQEALDAARAIQMSTTAPRRSAAWLPTCPRTCSRRRSTPHGPSRMSADRSEALSSLAPHLPADLQTQVLQEALDAARAIRDEHSRSRALSSLAPHLPADLQTQVLQEALDAARAIQNERLPLRGAQQPGSPPARGPADPGPPGGARRRTGHPG
jgi:hypothetical protein